MQTEDLGGLRAGRLELIERTADTLAHAIKNPLHAMVINLEVLRRRVQRAGVDDPADLLRYVEVLSGELQRVNQRVELLLRVARGGGDGETTLAELLENSTELLRLEAESSRVRFEIRSDPRLARVRVRAEPSRQLLIPLVLDAISAVPEGGEVAVVAGFEAGVRHVSIRARDRTGGPVSLSDADAGSVAAERIEFARSIAERWGGGVETLDTAIVLEFAPTG